MINFSSNNNNINNNNNPNMSINKRSVASLFSNYIDPAAPAAAVDDDNSADIVQAPKRLALQDSNISRYEKEFLQLSRIGE